MKVINLKHPLIAALHDVVMQEYNCGLCNVIGVRDTDAKFTAVFILSHFYDLPGRELAEVYTLNRMFVNTVVLRMQSVYAMCPDYAAEIHRILNYIEKYEGVDC